MSMYANEHKVTRWHVQELLKAYSHLREKKMSGFQKHPLREPLAKDVPHINTF